MVRDRGNFGSGEIAGLTGLADCREVEVLCGKRSEFLGGEGLGFRGGGQAKVSGGPFQKRTFWERAQKGDLAAFERFSEIVCVGGAGGLCEDDAGDAVVVG